MNRLNFLKLAGILLLTAALSACNDSGVLPGGYDLGACKDSRLVGSWLLDGNDQLSFKTDCNYVFYNSDTLQNEKGTYVESAGGQVTFTPYDINNPARTYKIEIVGSKMTVTQIIQ